MLKVKFVYVVLSGALEQGNPIRPRADFNFLNQNDLLLNSGIYISEIIPKPKFKKEKLCRGSILTFILNLISITDMTLP